MESEIPIETSRRKAIVVKCLNWQQWFYFNERKKNGNLDGNFKTNLYKKCKFWKLILL